MLRAFQYRLSTLMIVSAVLCITIGLNFFPRYEWVTIESKPQMTRVFGWPSTTSQVVLDPDADGISGFGWGWRPFVLNWAILFVIIVATWITAERFVRSGREP